MRGRWVLLALVAVALSASAFNVFKAFHIDDPLVLEAAENVLRDPMRPYSSITHQMTVGLPLWSIETNPPFLSYWLAPFVAIHGRSELALHLAMIPFVVILAVALRGLAHRFEVSPGLTIGFGLGNVGVMATTNVMRDVPATALAAAAIVLWISGVDSRSRRRLAAAAFLTGLAILTKYSSVVLLPLLALYALLRRAGHALPLLAIPLVMFGLWCLQNVHVHGVLHVVDMSRRSSGALVAWRDNLCGLPLALGSLLFLGPVVAWTYLRSSSWREATVAGGAVIVGVVGAALQLGGMRDVEVLLYLALGMLLLVPLGGQSLRDGWAAIPRGMSQGGGDDLFLGAWVGAFAAFSVLFPPFQAVRHLLPAVPAAVVLALRMIQSRTAGSPGIRITQPVVLGAQILLSAWVAIGDAEFAETYRSVTRERVDAIRSQRGATWYVGSWSLAVYGPAAGLLPLDPAEPAPRSGDRVLWPREVNQSDALRSFYRPTERWRRVETISIAARVPVRTVNRRGAHLYALGGRSPSKPTMVPYRIGLAGPLEEFDVFEIP